MGGVMRFVFALIWIALFLGATGNLVDATIYARDSAKTTFLKKGISAQWWNKQLSPEKK